jgi:CubicO group peptidase (beta-lactamase class C family)
MRRLALLLPLAVTPLRAQLPDRTALDALLQRAVDSSEIAGAVGLVLVNGKVVYRHAVGFADREARRPMRPDALFRIASQTKAITSVAIVQLIEAGKLRLDDPVSRWIPGYAKPMVASRTDANAPLVPAGQPITIRMLLTHTAGLSYGTEPTIAERYAAAELGPRAGNGWYTADKREPICATIDRLATLPLIDQPGARFVYGYNTDVLGCVVERASGLPLDRYIRERITEPLGMTNTWFYVPKEQVERLTTVYMRDSTRQLVRAPAGGRGQGDYVDGPRVSFSGGAGLVSTAEDYAKFLTCILNDGRISARSRLLSRRGARLLHTNLIGTRLAADGGVGYGAAFETTERFGAHGLLGAGSYGWGGAYGSWYRVDPESGAVMVFMQQTFGSGSDVRERFGQVVMATFGGR